MSNSNLTWSVYVHSKEFQNEKSTTAVLVQPWGYLMTNDKAREILFDARKHLIRRETDDNDVEAIQMLMYAEMGLAYNVSAPGRGI